MSKPSCINTAYKELESSILHAMTWTPKIRFLSTHLRIIDNKVYLNPTTTPTINTINNTDHHTATTNNNPIPFN